MVRSALVGVLVMVTVLACARPNAVQAPPTPTPTPTPSPSPTPTAPLQATTAPFHAGEVGAAYTAVALFATGGMQPYTWSISAGALPGGLSLSSDGHVTGTPNASGSFHFTAQVADGGGSTATLPATIGVADSPVAHLNPNCAGHCSVEVGCVNVCGDFGSLSGGTGPFTFSSSGSIPIGVHVQGFSLQGTFTTPANYWQFTVTATDAFGEAATISPTFYVFAHISLANGTCYGDYSTGCTARLPIGGGNGVQSVRLLGEAQNTTPNPPNQYPGSCWTPAMTTPPSGYSVAVSGSYVVVYIPPRNIAGYGAVWTLHLSDRYLCSAGTNCAAPDATVTIGVQCG
jgi:hypothetical protein